MTPGLYSRARLAPVAAPRNSAPDDARVDRSRGASYGVLDDSVICVARRRRWPRHPLGGTLNVVSEPLRAEDRWPADVERLFWDVEPQSVDLHVHADYVMDRVMTRGTLEAMRWLRATYSPAELAAFLRRKGHRLSPRDRAYWALVAGLEADDVPGGARPPWSGR